MAYSTAVNDTMLEVREYHTGKRIKSDIKPNHILGGNCYTAILYGYNNTEFGEILQWCSATYGNWSSDVDSIWNYGFTPTAVWFTDEKNFSWFLTRWQ